MIVLQGHRYRVESVGFSPDGAAVFAPTWQGVQMWRPFAAGGKPARLGGTFSERGRFRLTPDGRKLVTGLMTLRVLDLETGDSAEQPLWDGYEVFFALSHAGDVVVAGQNRNDGHRITARRVADGSALWERTTDVWWAHPLFLPDDEAFVRIGWEDNGRHSVFRLVTHAAGTGAELRRSNPLADEVRDWVISPDGTLAACRVTVWVHVYPLRSSFTKPLVTLRNDNRREFTGIAFHPSGKYLAATSNDQTVKLYDTTNWGVVKTYTWNVGRVRSVAFSPDGTLAAAGSDTGKVVVWDVDV